MGIALGFAQGTLNLGEDVNKLREGKGALWVWNGKG